MVQRSRCCLCSCVAPLRQGIGAFDFKGERDQVPPAERRRDAVAWERLAAWVLLVPAANAVAWKGVLSAREQAHIVRPLPFIHADLPRLLVPPIPFAYYAAPG